MKESILRREERDGKVIRHLECGHEQVQVSGGHAATANFASCKQCLDAAASQRRKHEPAPAGATCTGIIIPLRERRMRLCGKPARWMNGRGQPRCKRCIAKVLVPA